MSQPTISTSEITPEPDTCCGCEDSKFDIGSRDDVLCKLESMRKASVAGGLMSGLMIVRVDQYQRILGTYGYRFGVRLSKQIYQRLRDEFPGKAAIFPTGLDEFIVLLPSLKLRQQLGLAMYKIRQILLPQFAIEHSSFRVSITIGASYNDTGERDTPELMRLADSALLHASDHLKPCAIHDEIESKEEEIPFLELQLELERALAENELTSVFQPKVDIRTGDIVGVESLVRWVSPVFGFVKPDLIIATAERSGLINELTFKTLNNAMIQYDRWGEYAVPIAVNLSPEVIGDATLKRFLSRRNIWSMPVEALTLEVTETAFMQDPEKALAVFHELNNMGLKLSMDDFGTGYSSFAYLKNIPIREIKIDRAFIDNMQHDERDYQIVRTICELAKGFHWRVIAEGVEDEATYRLAMEAGCDVVQGYFISRPLPPDEFVEWQKQDAWFRP